MPASAGARCPRCGRPLRDATLEGLCPACLMRQALTTGASDDDPGTAADAGRQATGAEPTSVAFTVGTAAGAPASPALISSSLSASVWTLVTLMADDEEFVTYLAREHAPDARGAGGTSTSAQLAQLVVRKQHVAAAEVEHARQQLQRRRDALRQLRHPALARVLDGGLTEDGHPFLVTAFVMAAPLVDVDPEGVDPDSTQRLLDQARDALQALHGAGLAHGRVRASTVLARRANAGATTIVTGFAPLDRFAMLSDDIAFDLEQLQRLASTLRV